MSVEDFGHDYFAITREDYNELSDRLKATEEERDRAQGERDELKKDIAHIHEQHDADRAQFVTDYWDANARATAAEEQLQGFKNDAATLDNLLVETREQLQQARDKVWASAGYLADIWQLVRRNEAEELSSPQIVEKVRHITERNKRLEDLLVTYCKGWIHQGNYLIKLRQLVNDLIQATNDLITDVNRANNYATRNEHFNLPQVAEGYVDATELAIAAYRSLELKEKS